MRRIVVLGICTFSCITQITAQVIQYEIDTDFNPQQHFFNGSVSDILHTSSNDYLIMGMFGGTSLSSGLLSENGSLVYPNVVGGQKVVEYLQGFLSYGSHIKHVELGTGLTSFSFQFFKPAYSGPLSAKALDAMVLPDDHILVAGRFFTDSTLMGTAESHLGLRQLCMIDSTGAPVQDFPMLRCAHPVDAEIYSIRQLSTGQYIITGRFSEVEGHVTNSMARLNADFTVDTSFVSPFLNMKVVSTRYIDSQDRIWVFVEYGILNTDPENTVLNARIMPNGSVDTSFIIPLLLNQTTSNGTIVTSIGPVYEDSDGTFIVSSNFTHYNDTLRNRITKIYDNGSLVHGAFDGWGADDATWGSWTSQNGPGIGVIRALPDGKLLLGGRFSSFGGEPYSCLVRLQPSGFVGTDDREGNARLQLWPNPATGFVKLALSDPNEPIERLDICDLQGRTVLSPSFEQSSEVRIDIQGLPAGIYLIRAGSNKGVYSQKLIVN